MRIKFYLEEDAGTNTCVNRSETDSHTTLVDDTGTSFHIVVANTNTSTEAQNIDLEFRVLEDTILRAPDARDRADFGDSVAAVGENIVIGAPRHGEGWGTGQAYLFDQNGNHLTTLAAPDAQERARFGDSVAAFGENILVGAPSHDVGESEQAGQAYLFGQDGSHLQTFSAPDAQQYARFGGAVGAVGDKIIIGAPEHEIDGRSIAGKVYLFEADGTHLHTFSATDTSYSDGFGRSVASVNGNILIGARHHKVYLYGTDGTLLHTFDDPEAPTLSRFGADVAGIGENILVGAPGTQLSSGFDAGRVYMFDAEGSILQTFEAPDAQELAYFGGSVAAGNGNIIVGAPHHDTDAGLRAGQVYLFASDGAHLRTITAPDTQRMAQFGGSVAAVGDSILAGARHHDIAADESAGQAYLFVGIDQSGGD